jgi:hypothetical protein
MNYPIAYCPLCGREIADWRRSGEPPIGPDVSHSKAWPAVYRSGGIPIRILKGSYSMEKTAAIDDVLAITDRMSQETKAMFRKTDKQIKATNKKISDLGGHLGEIIEYITSPYLEARFKCFGIFFDTFIMEHSFEESGKGSIAAVDIFLSHGEYAVAVAVKSKPNIRDIDDHGEQTKKLRGHADRHNGHRKYRGAIADMVVRDR